MKTVYSTKDRKFKLVSGLFSFFFNEATTRFKAANLNYKELTVGDWVIAHSNIYHDRNWAGIGVLVKKGDQNGDGWKIKSLSGKMTIWNNEDFYRFPEEVQELFKKK